jgi:PAS domain S-box-containing protein
MYNSYNACHNGAKCRLAEVSASYIESADAYGTAMASESVSVRKPRKQRQARLVESRELAQVLMRSAGTGIYIVQQGQFEYVNSLFQEITGYTEAELLTARSLDLVHPEDREVVRKKAIESLKGQSSCPYEYRFVRKNGEVGWVAEKVTSATYKGKPAAVGSFVDITERKRIEQNLNERIKELSCLYGIARIAESPGITLDEIYRQVANLLPPSCQYPDIAFARIIIDGKAFKTANYSDSKWKQTSNIRVHGAKVGSIEVGYLEERPVTDEGPFLKEERLLLDAVAERLGRITERKQAEEALRQSREKLRLMFESTTDGMALSDLTGVILEANDRLVEMHGLSSKSELLGRKAFNMIAPPRPVKTR